MCYTKREFVGKRRSRGKKKTNGFFNSCHTPEEKKNVSKTKDQGVLVSKS